MNRIVLSGFKQFGNAKQLAALEVPKLEYGYKGLEPVLSAALLEEHHKSHHQKYLTELKLALKMFDDACSKLNHDLMAKSATDIRFNLGGYVNHCLYWENLAPVGKGGGELPGQDSQLTKHVKSHFGSYDGLIKEMVKKINLVQGSGWGFLAFDHSTNCLRVKHTYNQKTVGPHNMTPLLAIDVWEHAWDNDYKSAKPLYLTNIWKIMNWKMVEKRLQDALAKKSTI